MFNIKKISILLFYFLTSIVVLVLYFGVFGYIFLDSFFIKLFNLIAPNLMFWKWLSFIFLALFLGYFWDIIIEVFDNEKHKFDSLNKESKNNFEKSKLMILDSKKKIEDAKSIASNIIDLAHKEALEIKNESLNKAKLEYDKIIDKANIEVGLLKSDMVNKLNYQLGDIVTEMFKHLFEGEFDLLKYKKYISSIKINAKK